MKIAVDQLSNSNNFTSRFTKALAACGHTVVRNDMSIKAMCDADVVLFHWPTLFLGNALRRDSWPGLLKLAAAKAISGTKVIWVAHNAVEHEGGPKDAFLRSGFLALLDGVIYLSNASRDIIRKQIELPARVVEAVIPHGVYEFGDKPTPFSIEQSGSQAVRFLCFGLIRPYKGYEGLIEAASSIGDRSVSIDIVGRSYDRTYAEKIETSAKMTGNVRTDFSEARIPDNELNDRIDACHGVLLVHRNLLNSGVAIHALSRNRPILAPRLGSLPELQLMAGEDWVQLYDGDIGADAIDRFAHHVRSAGLHNANLLPMQWHVIERQLQTFLLSVGRSA